MEQYQKVNVKTDREYDVQILEDTELFLDNGTISGELVIQNPHSSENRMFVGFTVYNEEGYIVFDDIQKIQFNESKTKKVDVTIHPDIRTNEQQLTLKLTREN